MKRYDLTALAWRLLASACVTAGVMLLAGVGWGYSRSVGWSPSYRRGHDALTTSTATTYRSRRSEQP